MMNLYGVWNHYLYPSDISIPAGAVLWQLVADPNGRFWTSVWKQEQYMSDGKLFGTGKTVGLLLFDQEQWIYYPVSELGLSERSIRLMACDLRGYIWLYISPNTICRFDGRTTDIFRGGERGLPLSFGTVDAFAADIEGGVWAALGTAGAFYFDGSLWKRLSLEDRLVDGSMSNVTVDQAGRAWFAMEKDAHAVFARYDAMRLQYYCEAPISVETAHVEALAVDKKGILWVGWSYMSGYEEAGLWALEKAGGEWTQYTTENSALPDPNILSLCVDNVGRVWAGTSEGFAIFDGADSVVWRAIMPGIPHGPISEEEVDQAITLGTPRSSYTYIGHFAVTDSHSRVWALSHNGISVFSEA
jgi:ligand-binding sensor domain-containing protein